MKKTIRASGLLILIGVIGLATIISRMEYIPFTFEMVGPAIYWGIVVILAICAIAYTIQGIDDDSYWISGVLIAIIIILGVRELICAPKPIDFYSQLGQEGKKKYVTTKDNKHVIILDAVVDKVKTATVDNKTKYFLIFKGNKDQIFTADISLSPELPFTEEGTPVIITYDESNAKDATVNIKSFDNPFIN